MFFNTQPYNSFEKKNSNFFENCINFIFVCLTQPFIAKRLFLTSNATAICLLRIALSASVPLCRFAIFSCLYSLISFCKCALPNAGRAHDVDITYFYIACSVACEAPCFGHCNSKSNARSFITSPSANTTRSARRASLAIFILFAVLPRTFE